MDREAITVGPGMDMPIMHDSDRFELVKDIGSGNFGVARLMRDKHTQDLVAVKYIERGDKGKPGARRSRYARGLRRCRATTGLMQTAFPSNFLQEAASTTLPLSWSQKYSTYKQEKARMLSSALGTKLALLTQKEKRKPN